jgi:mannitol 2-dehydrogenase
MQRGAALDWAIIGAGVRPGDAAMREKLLAQDCLTTLIELRPDRHQCRSLRRDDRLPARRVRQCALIAQMADPAIRIVSLTVTEGGYFVNPATGAFDAAHPDIAHDARKPEPPAHRVRRDRGGPAGGAMRARALYRTKLRQPARQRRHHARYRDRSGRLSDPALAAWIDRHCTFPELHGRLHRARDRPGRDRGGARLGIEDAAPVTHENYRQWVIEDAFCAGRPDWDGWARPSPTTSTTTRR